MEIERELAQQPIFCAASERLVETERHLGRDRSSTVDNIVQRLAGYAKTTCTFGNSEAESVETHRADKPPWVVRIIVCHVNNMRTQAGDHRQPTSVTFQQG